MARRISEDDLPPDMKVCNCAGCGVLLMGVNQPADVIKWLLMIDEVVREMYPPYVFEKVEGRPHCMQCFTAKMAPKLESGI